MSVAVTHVDVRASAVANARALERSSAQFYALQTDLLMESNREGAEHDVQYAVDVVEQNNRFGIIGRGGNFISISDTKWLLVAFPGLFAPSLSTTETVSGTTNACFVTIHIL